MRNYLQNRGIHVKNHKIRKSQLVEAVAAVVDYLKSTKSEHAPLYEYGLISVDGKKIPYEELDKVSEVKGDLDLSGLNLEELPDMSKMVVHGDFDCTDNRLISLKGSPKKVGGSFMCYNNELSDLEGSPQEVGGSFMCGHNALTSLSGSPKAIGGSFYCESNFLENLEDSPLKVGGDFDCSDNSLTSLAGSPQEVPGHFICDHNNLSSLEFGPLKVGKNYICGNNDEKFSQSDVLEITSVKGKIIV